MGMFYNVHIGILLLAFVPMQLAASDYPYRLSCTVANPLINYPSEYAGITQEVADLPIYCLQNSLLARTARIGVFDAHDGSKRATIVADENPVLDSTTLQDPPFTVGQILNAIPHEFVTPSNDSSKSYFWRHFCWHTGVPLVFFRMGSLFSAHVKKINIEKLALFTGVLGSAVGIGLCLYSLCTYNDSGMSPSRWLRTHVQQAGNLDGKPHELATNARNLQFALAAITTGDIQRQQQQKLQHYRYIHYKTNTGRFLGGISVACLAGIFLKHMRRE